MKQKIVSQWIKGCYIHCQVCYRVAIEFSEDVQCQKARGTAYNTVSLHFTVTVTWRFFH